jgi:tol-pal system protein YbgF
MTDWKRSVGWTVAAAAVLAGCSFGRPDSAVSPRAQVKDAPASSDLQALRQENESLKQEQLQSARQIEALQKQLASDKEEQRRFREMMSTNFDLLEQSVALTLAKSIDGGANGKATAPATAPMTPPAGRPGPSGAADKTPVTAPLPAIAPAAVKPAPTEVSAPEESPEPAGHPAPMGATAPKAIGQATRPATRGSAPGATALTPAAPARPQSSASGASAAQKTAAKAGLPVGVAPETAVNDPDLTPPKHPKTLTANRAAKALYERGFALYANRQYDQAVLVYQNFLSRYPEDIYSDNAQFWIGESYLHMDKLAEAEAAYRKVLREYEHKNSLDGYKTSEAIYRLGTLAQKRNDARRARFYFGNVVQRFPESSAGRKAQHELEGKPQSTAQSEAEEDKAGG